MITTSWRESIDRTRLCIETRARHRRLKSKMEFTNGECTLAFSMYPFSFSLRSSAPFDIVPGLLWTLDDLPTQRRKIVRRTYKDCIVGWDVKVESNVSRVQMLNAILKSADALVARGSQLVEYILSIAIVILINTTCMNTRGKRERAFYFSKNIHERHFHSLCTVL